MPLKTFLKIALTVTGLTTLVFVGCAPAPSQNRKPIAIEFENTETGGKTPDDRAYTTAQKDDYLGELRTQIQETEDNKSLAVQIKAARVDRMDQKGTLVDRQPERLQIKLILEDANGKKSQLHVEGALKRDANMNRGLPHFPATVSKNSSFEVGANCQDADCDVSIILVGGRRPGQSKASYSAGIVYRITKAKVQVKVPATVTKFENESLQEISVHYREPQEIELREFEVLYGKSQSQFSLESGKDKQVCVEADLVETNKGPVPSGLCGEGGDAQGISIELIGNSRDGSQVYQMVAKPTIREGSPETVPSAPEEKNDAKEEPPKSEAKNEDPTHPAKEETPTIPRPRPRPDDLNTAEDEVTEATIEIQKEEVAYIIVEAKPREGQAQPPVEEEVEVQPENPPAAEVQCDAHGQPSKNAEPKGLIQNNLCLPKTRAIHAQLEKARNQKVVKEYIEYWSGKKGYDSPCVSGSRKQDQGRRMEKFAMRVRPSIKHLAPLFEAEDVPLDFIYLLAIESAYFIDKGYPVQKSSAGASGPWQFMPRTARSMGLKTSPVDERNYLRPSTRAAAKYISKILAMFPQDPYLAVLGYNRGEYGIKDVTEDAALKMAVRVRDIDAWFLLKHDMIKSCENREYVKNFAGARFVGDNLVDYGFTLPSDEYSDAVPAPDWDP